MKKRILSGMRPTGQLHLGNYFGALTNWVKLQDKYECFYMLADWHALTTDYADTSSLKENINLVLLDWLAAGIDPEKATIFIQSQIKEHAELALLLSMITPLSWLERNPTYKEQLKELKNKDLSTHGFLGYPVLQAADILIYKAEVVPVGEDQLPHLELAREIARRFNYLYGKILPEPRSLLTPLAKLPGIDGRKMSKSYDNCIYLTETRGNVENKVRQMFTDPQKIRATDPGHPQGCVVYAFWQALAPEKANLHKQECEQGKIGCLPDKKELAQVLNQFLEPFREKYTHWSKETKKIKEILLAGEKKARVIAEQTLSEVRTGMNLFNDFT